MRDILIDSVALALAFALNALTVVFVIAGIFCFEQYGESGLALLGMLAAVFPTISLLGKFLAVLYE